MYEQQHARQQLQADHRDLDLGYLYRDATTTVRGAGSADTGRATWSADDDADDHAERLNCSEPRVRALFAQYEDLDLEETTTDDFEYGLDQKLTHRPALAGRGKPIAYYAVATTTTTTPTTEGHRA